MTKAILFASAAVLTLAACGERADDSAPNSAAIENVAVADDGATVNDTAAMDAAVPAAMGADFLNAAASSDMFEIDSSKLAIERTKDAKVRAFAQMLVKDHQKSTADLIAAATNAVPKLTPAPALNAEMSANMAALKAAADGDFDRTYLAQQIPAHEKALAMLQAYGANGDIAAVKDWAGKTSAPVAKHLEEARALSK